MSNRKKPNTTTSSSPDVASLLAEDGRPEDVVPICLRGHLQADWSRLKAQHDASPSDDDEAMMAERATKRRIAEQMREVEEQMRAGTVEFRLRALPRRRTPSTPTGQLTWHELVQEHPPRKDSNGKLKQQDAAMGVNMQTFLDALVRASTVEPELDDDAWAELDAKLNDGQFEKLADAAWKLNRSEVDIPFSRAVSIIRSSGGGSRRQNDSASA